MSSLKKNVHAIEIRSDVGRVLPQVLLWGEAAWWPKDSRMRFLRTTAAGAITVGTRYRQEVLLPFAPSWNVAVEGVTGSGITRRFLDGMFSGYETVTCKPVKGGVVVSYEMFYRLNGLLNKVLWPLVFEKMHNANIEIRFEIGLSARIGSGG